MTPQNPNMPPKAATSRQTSTNKKSATPVIATTAGPSDDSPCTQCKEKLCYGTVSTGSGANKRENKQKVKSEWISCDICSRWFHGTCQGLKPEEVILIVKLNTSGVRWFCSDCAPGLTDKTDHVTLKKLSTIEKMITSLDHKVESYQSQTTEEVKKLEKSWADVVSGAEITDNIKQIQQNVFNTQSIISKELETKDAEKRKTNAIILGVAEETSAIEDIKKLMQKDIFKQFDVPEHATRLGTKGDAPRPIKLRFSTEKSKWEFLKRSNASLREERIFCRLDVNAKVREQEYQLRQRLKQLKNDNSDQEYRIRNMTIEQKIQPSGNWERLKPVEQQQVGSQG